MSSWKRNTPNKTWEQHLNDGPEDAESSANQLRITFESMQLTMFSDTIIISMSMQHINAVAVVIPTVVCRVTESFALMGSPIRGGISVGKLVHDHDVILGPALVKAYELESAVATFPRVVIADELMDRIGVDIAPDWHYRRDSDGAWYIDFFAKMREDHPLIWRRALPALHDLVIEGLRDPDPRVLAKYRWLANRFNATLPSDSTEAPIVF